MSAINNVTGFVRNAGLGAMEKVSEGFHKADTNTKIAAIAIGAIGSIYLFNTAAKTLGDGVASLSTMGMKGIGVIAIAAAGYFYLSGK